MWQVYRSAQLIYPGPKATHDCVLGSYLRHVREPYFSTVQVPYGPDMHTRVSINNYAYDLSQSTHIVNIERYFFIAGNSVGATEGVPHSDARWEEDHPPEL